MGMDYKEIKTKLIKAIIDEMDQGIDPDITPASMSDQLVILESALDHYRALLDFVAQDTPVSIYVEQPEDPYEPNLVIRLSDRRGITYEIRLYDEPDMRGYCMCEPEDEGYDELHRCCGIDCDWYVPRISISKILEVGDEMFEGVERDLWKAKDDFMDKYFGEGSAHQLELINEKEQLLSDISHYQALLLDASMRLEAIDDELQGE